MSAVDSISVPSFGDEKPQWMDVDLSGLDYLVRLLAGQKTYDAVRQGVGMLRRMADDVYPPVPKGTVPDSSIEPYVPPVPFPRMSPRVRSTKLLNVTPPMYNQSAAQTI